MMRLSLHRRFALHRLAARVLAAPLLLALVLLALVVVPPLALAVSAGVAVATMQATMQGGHEAADDCAAHHAGGPDAAVRPAMPVKAADHPCKTGCAACDTCIFVQAVLLPSAVPLRPRLAAVVQPADVPGLRLTRRSHPPLRPPSI
ncbi:hypothetical protein [Ferrovibrio xuzhouensis]|uniref:CopL family metal-binding regulatory protein n=1 Tax=Ferrovibrio xuzhouensis TaxID=1576914 RepID=A0ABV7V9H2_9PROT